MQSKPKRNHHYIPKFHLGGFTKKGEIESPLWVFDTKKGKQWEAKPNSVAFQKDLYKIDLPGIKTDVLEDLFNIEIENKVAPVIKNICTNYAMPKNDNHILLMNYIALLAMRTPERIEHISSMWEDISKFVMQMTTTTQESFEATIQGTDKISVDDYETIKKIVAEDSYKINFDNSTLMESMLHGTDAILPALMERKWTVVQCPSTIGDFICSDNPVNLHWTDSKDRGIFSSPGFGLLNTEVSVPLSSRIMLLGRFDNYLPERITVPSLRQLAILNSFTGINSKRYVFSRKENFYWFTSEGKVADTNDFKDKIKNG
ncbi:MAG: DUF4238 domain-containing protein [Bacillota bacterium]